MYFLCFCGNWIWILHPDSDFGGLRSAHPSWSLCGVAFPHSGTASLHDTDFGCLEAQL